MDMRGEGQGQQTLKIGMLLAPFSSDQILGTPMNN
jgi:hypothetical protein